ncbi:hypothetical protein QVD17_09594 [Tagetes erecta]|uniref:Uncharacterized protein n=1 Tax=Tagetes erecta TaxID=13708 RepID=A0AAD8L4Y8_TARER|nr:hypothetical protein QVD17_09594 [Tagetes erecta]
MREDKAVFYILIEVPETVYMEWDVKTIAKEEGFILIKIGSMNMDEVMEKVNYKPKNKRERRNVEEQKTIEVHIFQTEEGDDGDNGELGIANADAGNRVEFVMGPIIKQAAISEMDAAIDIVSHDLSKLRTGRAIIRNA